MSLTCAAILCIRNEAPHIDRAIRNFIEQGIDVVVIDHGSTDRSSDICKQFLGYGLLSIESMPWTGVFDLTRQLEIKKEISEQLDHDWIIHADADEWLHSPLEEETLLQGIQRVSHAGFNVINFEEFVFLPCNGQNVDIPGYEKKILNYYFFAPHEQRLMRAWERSSGVQNLSSGGHRLSGKYLNISPDYFVLRHYLVLSYEHAVRKYSGRVFSDQDLVKNWHGNRLNLNHKQLELPACEKLKRLDRWDSTDFDRTDPKKCHYWDWAEATG